jgi:hypothetical protein
MLPEDNIGPMMIRGCNRYESAPNTIDVDAPLELIAHLKPDVPIKGRLRRVSPAVMTPARVRWCVEHVSAAPNCPFERSGTSRAPSAWCAPVSVSIFSHSRAVPG